MTSLIFDKETLLKTDPISNRDLREFVKILELNWKCTTQLLCILNIKFALHGVNLFFHCSQKYGNIYDLRVVTSANRLTTTAAFISSTLVAIFLLLFFMNVVR